MMGDRLVKYTGMFAPMGPGPPQAPPFSYLCSAL